MRTLYKNFSTCLNSHRVLLVLTIIFIFCVFLIKFFTITFLEKYYWYFFTGLLVISALYFILNTEEIHKKTIMVDNHQFLYTFIFIITMLFSVFLHFYHLGKLGLWWDEGIGSAIVHGISKTGLPIFESGLFYTRGIIYYYFAYVIALLLGDGEFSLRLTSAFFSIGTIAAVYFFLKKFDVKLALVVTAFLVLSPYQLEIGRLFRFYSALEFFSLITFIFFYNGFFKNNLKYKFFSVLSFIAIILNEATFSFLFFVIIVTLFFFVWASHRFKVKQFFYNTNIQWALLFSVVYIMIVKILFPTLTKISF